MCPAWATSAIILQTARTSNKKLTKSKRKHDAAEAQQNVKKNTVWQAKMRPKIDPGALRESG